MTVAPTNMKDVFAAVKAATAKELSEKSEKAATAALEKVLKSDTIIGYLADRTSRWLPPTNVLTQTALWGVFDWRETHRLTADDVLHVVVDNGGKSADAQALWRQMSPDGKKEINATDFADNKFLVTTMAAMLPNLKELVTTETMKRGADVNSTMLGMFNSLYSEGPNVLDVLA